jgi:hypothetical protein
MSKSQNLGDLSPFSKCSNNDCPLWLFREPEMTHSLWKCNNSENGSIFYSCPLLTMFSTPKSHNFLFGFTSSECPLKYNIILHHNEWMRKEIQLTKWKMDWGLNTKMNFYQRNLRKLMLSPISFSNSASK